MEARVDLDDHTTQLCTSKVINTIISMCFNVFLGINPRSLFARSTHAFNRMRQGGVERCGNAKQITKGWHRGRFMHDMLETSGVLLNPCRAATKSTSNHAWSKQRAANVPGAFGGSSGIYILKKLTVSFRNSWSFKSYLPVR
jgi:hypothetical protein